MPEYSYIAKTRSGEKEEGTLTAPDRLSAGRILREKGLLPTKISEKKESAFSFTRLSQRLTHVSLLEKLTFIKNLGVTLRAGLPIARALKVVSEQMPNAYFKSVSQELAKGVESGRTLSESMAEYPNVFSQIFVSMVKVGEQTGELDKSLEYLAKQIERDYNLIRRTRGALLYPAIVLVALLVIGYLMFAFVLPRLTETFTEFDIELPVLTKIIIAVVDVFSAYSVLVLVFLLAVAVGIWLWYRAKSGQYFFHKFFLKLPVIGNIVRKVNLARFTIIFSSLLHSGMPIVEALKITGDTMGNVYYRDALHAVSEKVRVGVDLETALEKNEGLFTPMVTQMIRVGEESGTMEEVLSEVANFYEAEIDDSVKNLSSVIEPVLVILIGVVVGFLAVGLIMPIYNLGAGI